MKIEYTWDKPLLLGVGDTLKIVTVYSDLLPIPALIDVYVIHADDWCDWRWQDSQS